MEAGLHNKIISVPLREFTVLGRIQDFREGGSRYGPPKAILWGPGNPLLETFEDFRNGIYFRHFEAKSECCNVYFFFLI